MVAQAAADLPDVSSGWYRTMLVTFFPVGSSWQIPCLTGYGNWNGYPEPADHAAILRYWDERYGAHLLAMSGDTVDRMSGAGWPADDTLDQGTRTTEMEAPT